MIREFKLEKHDLTIKACITKDQTKDSDFKIERIAAVDLSNSKSIEILNNDYGMAVYNEFGFGFCLSWKDFEAFQEAQKIQEEQYEEFLDNITSDLVDSVIKHVNDLKK